MITRSLVLCILCLPFVAVAADVGVNQGGGTMWSWIDPSQPAKAGEFYNVVITQNMVAFSAKDVDSGLQTGCSMTPSDPMYEVGLHMVSSLNNFSGNVFVMVDPATSTCTYLHMYQDATLILQ